MRLRRQKVRRESPFAVTDDLNPWLLSLRHMDTLSIQFHSIGFRTTQLRYANRHLNPDRGIGATFLVNTRLHPHRAELDASAVEYFTSMIGPVIARSGSESLDSTETVHLPDPACLQLPLTEVLQRRQSARAFSGDPMQLSDLATILHAAGGITHEATATAIDRPVSYPLRFRTVPSAGGLYAVTCHCVVLRVRQLADGAYQYLPYSHALAKASAVSSDDDALADALLHLEASGIDLHRIAAAIVLIGNPSKLARKYGDRGIRYLLLEAGMIAFAANLAASALGWGVLDYQSFDDAMVERCVGVRTGQHHALHVMLLGWPVTT
jgi:SagB-type dehydrogenase family enzyme